MYRGTPPWDIGRPQPAFVALADAGRLKGAVLDCGCGTGEHVLMAAERGLDATGIDSSARAIALAREKAAQRGLTAEFRVADALKLGELGRQYETVLDSGLFHIFDDALRAEYVASLGEVVRTGGTYFLCCFSDRQPGDWGPRRITQDELRASFARGWRVEAIEAVTFDVLVEGGKVEAWLSTITRE